MYSYLHFKGSLASKSLKTPALVVLIMSFPFCFLTKKCSCIINIGESYSGFGPIPNFS